MSAKKPTKPKQKSVFERFPHYAQAIGQATGEMAMLENLLGRMMGTTLRIAPDLGQMLYLSSHTPFGRVATLDLAVSSALPATSAAIAQIKALNKDVREVLQVQHQMAHEIWKIAGAPRQVSAARITAHTAALSVHAARIRAIADKVRKTIDDVRRSRPKTKS